MVAFLIIMYFVVGVVVAACFPEDFPNFPIVLLWPGFLLAAICYAASWVVRRLIEKLLDRIGL